MKDPVLLPGSGNIVDRVNIHRWLLSNEQDPFTRQAMKESDVVEQPHLKEEIEVWKKKRMQEIKQGGKKVKYANHAVIKDEKSEKEIFGNNPILKEE